MEEIAHSCPVARSLHPDVKVETRFALLTAAVRASPGQLRRSPAPATLRTKPPGGAPNQLRQSGSMYRPMPALPADVGIARGRRFGESRSVGIGSQTERCWAVVVIVQHGEDLALAANQVGSP